MKTLVLLATTTLSLGMLTGCGGGSGGEKGGTQTAAQPKYPNLWGTVHGPHGHSGGPIWDEVDGGFETYTYGRGTDMEDRRTRVNVKPIYKGTTDAGDSFELEVTIGDLKETKEALYDGKKVEVEIIDGVKYVMQTRRVR